MGSIPRCFRRRVVQTIVRCWLRRRVSYVWVEGGHLLTPTRSQVLLANHIAVLDSALLITAMSRIHPTWYVWAADRIVKRYGRFYGDAYMSVGNGRIGDARALVERSVERLLQTPCCLLIYPQGEHTLESEHVQAMRGAEFLAQRLRSSRLKVDVERGSEPQFLAVGIAYQIYRIDRPQVAIVFREIGDEVVITTRVIEAEITISRDLASGVLRTNSRHVKKVF